MSKYEINQEVIFARAAMQALDLDRMLSRHGRYTGAVSNTVKHHVADIDGKQVLVVLTNDEDEMV